MTMNLSNSLAGLSLLTGGNAFAGMGFGLSVESRAVRLAKAQFTTPETTPPWKEKPSTTPASVQLSAIKRLASLIDKPTARNGLPADVQTAFVAYKALDRMRLLAETAVKSTISATERTSLQNVFAKGLADLQGFLGQAPSDKVNLAFAQPARRADSVAIAAPDPFKVVADGVVATRDAALPGLTGSEVFRLTLTRNGSSDVVTVDLAQTPQPPTLDSVANAFNAAISAIPMLDVNGNPVLDADGNVRPKWEASFTPDKSTGSWGLALDTLGVGQVSVDQVGAGNAIMVASGLTALDAPTATRITRFDDPAGALQQRTLATISAVDRLATEQAALLAPPPDPKATEPAEPKTVLAATQTRAIASDGNGFSYVVGTTAGDIGDDRLAGSEDLFLTKLDAQGKVVWQRTLGAAGSSDGAAISIAANGDIVVAGTVSGGFGGVDSDGDMVVARFDANGDEQFSTLVRAVGAGSAQAVTVGADGSIFVGGRAATGIGDAFVTRLDATGRIQERRTIDSGGVDSVKALAIDSSGELLALVDEGGTARLRRRDAQALATDLGTLDLGSADARGLAVASPRSTEAGDGR